MTHSATRTADTEADTPKLIAKIIGDAITRHLGRDDWQLREVMPHVRCVTDPKTKIETYSFGEKPILEIYPAEETKVKKKPVWTVRYREIL